ncbi:hypothetical protein KKE60_06085 [Patescibacteria group bacterium]|nr:hypothetical protein [Patescibacteria group bacterium]
MNLNDLGKAMKEAERFLKTAKAVYNRKTIDIEYGCKETAAAKRASMDLSRALSIIRLSTKGVIC